MELPQRKSNRIPQFDYSTPGAYFITICTKNRQNLFWKDTGMGTAHPDDVMLSAYGMIVEDTILSIPIHYPAVSVDNYVVMPNHVHLLLQIHTDEHGMRMYTPAISTVIQQMKGYASKRIGHPVWQKLFHDHVVRDEKDYLKIWEYIDHNPLRWTEDCFYAE